MAKAATKAKQPEIQTITLPPLQKDEHYAGIIFENGAPKHHLILLPGDVSKNWHDAVAWAAEQGGELATRKEQALLFANAADQFKRDWYWSGEQSAGNSDSAWGQGFYGGGQGNGRKAITTRVRAVRRVVIQ